MLRIDRRSNIELESFVFLHFRDLSVGFDQDQNLTNKNNNFAKSAESDHRVCYFHAQEGYGYVKAVHTVKQLAHRCTFQSDDLSLD